MGRREFVVAASIAVVSLIVVGAYIGIAHPFSTNGAGRSGPGQSSGSSTPGSGNGSSSSGGGGGSPGGPGGRDGGGRSGPATPLKEALAIGAAIEASAGSDYFVNFTVETASTNLTWGDLLFEVVDASHQAKVGAAVVVVATIPWKGCSVGLFNLTTSMWEDSASNSCYPAESEGLIHVLSGEQLDVNATASIFSSSNSLEILGIGAFNQSVSCSIP